MTIFTWSFGLSGDWSTAADWTPSGVPGAGDTVDIGVATNLDVAPWTLTATNEAAAALLFDPAGASGATLSVSGLLDVTGTAAFDAGTLAMQPGATLATAGTLTLGVAGAPGGGAVVTMGTGDLIAAASLAVFDGSTLAVGGGAVALGDAVAVAGALAVGGNALLSGDTGTIDGNVVNQGTMVVDAPVIGGPTGALTITGSLTDDTGITLASGAAMMVDGDLVDNALVVMDAGSALGVAGNATLAYATGLQLGADALLLVGGSLTVGGTLSATAGGDTIAMNGALSLNADSSLLATGATLRVGLIDETYGTLSIAGGSLTQTGSGENTIGYGSNVLSGGADWTVSQLTVGLNQTGGIPTSTTLDLTGSTLTVGGALTLGTPALTTGNLRDNYDGGAAGTLDVQDGSVVTATGLTLTGGRPSTVVMAAGGLMVIGSAAAVAGAVVVASGATLAANDGLIEGNLVLQGGLTVEPSSGAAGGMTIDGSLTGQGAISVRDGSFPQIGGDPAFASASTLDIADASGFTGPIALRNETTLILGGTGRQAGSITVGHFAGSAANWSNDATLDFTGVTYEAFNVPRYNGATGLLVVGAATVDVGLGYAPDSFVASPDSGTGTDVLLGPTPCYAAGTRIATPGGETPVEALRPGDAVLTLDGPRPVRWVGRFTVDLDRHPAPAHAAPVRIRAHAMAENVPARDLLVSPDHALFIDGVLMQAQSLVNGATILRAPPAGRITYFHVELDRHAILFAEGLAAESYLDTGNRGAFAGEAGARPLFADLTRRTWAADACAPLLLDGAAVVAAHCRLLARAHALGHRLTADPALAVLADGAAVPLRRDGALAWRARLPANVTAVRLRSRAFVPNDFGAAGDGRRLGIAVASLRFHGQAMPAGGPGWHAAEPGWRWTDGDASVTLPSCPRPSWLRIRAIDAGARYWAAPRHPLQCRVADGGGSRMRSHSTASRR